MKIQITYRSKFTHYVSSLLIFLPQLALAGTQLQLDARVSSKIANDEMVVTVGTVRTGQNVASLNEAVLSALNDAIKTAAAVPRITARLAGVNTQMNWRDGKQVGWQVNGDITLTSNDIPALAKLAGTLGKTLQLQDVMFRLSDSKRQQEETRLLSEAAAAFRAKSAAAVKAFGFQRYEIEELSLNNHMDFIGPHPLVVERAMARMPQASPVPAESGTTDVIVTVTGKIQMDEKNQGGQIQ